MTPFHRKQLGGIAGALPDIVDGRLVVASLRQTRHLSENDSLKMSYLPEYALLCMENAPITV